MSKTLVIVTHPNIEQSHVNKSWVEALKAHPDLYTVHEIYKLYPDGKIDVAAEQKLLESYDNIVLQFPMYWYSSPALLKQWQDDIRLSIHFDTPGIPEVAAEHGLRGIN